MAIQLKLQQKMSQQLEILVISFEELLLMNM